MAQEKDGVLELGGHASPTVHWLRVRLDGRITPVNICHVTKVMVLNFKKLCR